MASEHSGNISIKQIAQLTGLSVATVSRVINRKGYYSSVAEEKVRRVVEEYHYVPNMIARSLKTNRTDTIGIVIPDINGDYFSKAVLRFQLAFFKRGYSTVIFNTNHDLKLASACMNMMRSNQVSGIIDFTGNVGGAPHGTSVPILYFDRKSERVQGAPYIVSDNEKGGRLAARHLFERGCRRLAVVTPQHLYSNHRERLNGFLRELENCGLPREKTLHLCAQGYTIQHGCDAVSQTLAQGTCDGIFAVSDYLTTGILQAINHLGIDVPQQVRIVGYDVDTVLRLIQPSFTSIAQPLEQLTDLAVSHLMQMIEGAQTPADVTLPVTLLVGGTT